MKSTRKITRKILKCFENRGVDVESIDLPGDGIEYRVDMMTSMIFWKKKKELIIQRFARILPVINDIKEQLGSYIRIIVLGEHQDER